MKKIGLQDIVFVAILAMFTVVMSGCTSGQLAPQAIKTATIAAQVDAQYTAAQIRSGQASTQPAEVKLQKALDCLDRIGNRETGLLSPVINWFTGTKPAVK